LEESPYGSNLLGFVLSSRVLLQGKILGGLLAASASKHLGTLAALLGGFLGEIGLKRIS